MKIALVTPASADSARGNWTTAARWATRLAELGHEVAIEQEWSGGGEMLLALHAYRSLASIRRFRLERGPDAPLVVALTGTDVYRDLDRYPEARDALALATRFVTLQPAAIERLPAALRARALRDLKVGSDTFGRMPGCLSEPRQIALLRGGVQHLRFLSRVRERNPGKIRLRRKTKEVSQTYPNTPPTTNAAFHRASRTSW